MVRFLLISAASFLSLFYNLQRPIDDVCMVQIIIIVDPSHLVANISYGPVVFLNVCSNSFLIVTLLSTRSDFNADIIQFDVYTDKFVAMFAGQQNLLFEGS